VIRTDWNVKPSGRGGRHYLPYASTEHRRGHALLRAQQQAAVQMNILVIGVFITLREILATNKDLARKLETLEG